MAIAVFFGGLLIGATGSAAASPPPTLSQAQAGLAKLQTQLDQLSQQYDQVQQQLSDTDQRLAVIDNQEAAYAASFATERRLIGLMAVTAYEDPSINSSLALLSAGKPQQILDQGSILQWLSASDNAQLHQFVTAARQLSATQALAQRTQAGILQLKNSLGTQKAAMAKLVSQQQALVAQLTPAQVAAVSPGGGTTTGTYTGPTATQAQKAVAYAYAQQGCPYVYGGTGPCNYGFDCSGLTMKAWAAAGVSIPRDSYSQWAGLPHISRASIQPGDILVFDGEGHVAIYIGNGELIDALNPTAGIHIRAFAGWYDTYYDGALRP
jgi:cell wall-associated NlpC family hydrolase